MPEICYDLERLQISTAAPLRFPLIFLREAVKLKATSCATPGNIYLVNFNANTIITKNIYLSIEKAALNYIFLRRLLKIKINLRSLILLKLQDCQLLLFHQNRQQ